MSRELAWGKPSRGSGYGDDQIADCRLVDKALGANFPRPICCLQEETEPSHYILRIMMIILLFLSDIMFISDVVLLRDFSIEV